MYKPILIVSSVNIINKKLSFMKNLIQQNINLTKTEKRFIKLLVESKEVNFSTIANKLNITKQAVSKIKKKLEENGVLGGIKYNINVESIGISLYSIMDLSFAPDVNIYEVITYLKNSKNVVYIMESKFPDEQLMVYSGFKDIKELEKFCDDLKTNFFGMITKKSGKIIYPEKIHKGNYNDLILHSLIEDEKPKIQIEFDRRFKSIKTENSVI